LKDNSSFGEFDFDELANNWDQSLIDAAGIDIPAVEEEEDEEEAQDDDFDVEGNIPKKPISKMGDLYILGNHRLICGDATKQEYYEALFGNSKTADLIVTDPPYNVDYQGGTKDKLKIQNDSMSDSQFYNFLLDAFTQMAQFTKAGGSFYIWHGDKERINFNKAAVASGLLPHQTLIWNKNSFVLGRQDYQWRHEPCLYGWKEGAAHNFTKNRALSTVIDEIENFDINKATKDELKTMLEKIMDRDIPTTVIDENKPLRSEDHPTMKPIPLLARGIKNSSKPNEIILDPFGGSGSTMIAAEQLTRRCFMMELDGRYVDVIVKRWEELTGNTAQLVGNLLEQSGTAENSPKNS
jgi:DNA modification methylase